MKILILFISSIISFMSFAEIKVSDKLIHALITVESNNVDTAVGDRGKSVGCLQIQKCVIDDVNRIYKTNYSYNDRLSRIKSINIAKLYLSHYGNIYKRDTGKYPSNEVISRIWNRGPYGYKSRSSVKYWIKVRSYL